jgi:hypothetical protein
MDGNLRQSAQERQACLKVLRQAGVPRRVLLLLLLHDALSYRRLQEVAFASPDLIRAVKRDFAAAHGDCFCRIVVPVAIPSCF